MYAIRLVDCHSYFLRLNAGSKIGIASVRLRRSSGTLVLTQICDNLLLGTAKVKLCPLICLLSYGTNSANRTCGAQQSNCATAKARDGRSVIPTSLGVNPQLTIMAMATRIAFKMRDRWRAVA